MREAMSLVREHMGPDAIIVSSFQGQRGRGVEVRAALDEPLPDPVPADDCAAPPDTDILEQRLRARLEEEIRALKALRASGADAANRQGLDPDQAAEITKALSGHKVPEALSADLAAAAQQAGEQDPEHALSAALGAHMACRPLECRAYRPVVLVGPPGAGKTVTAAKLIAANAIERRRCHLISTDTVKTGAVAQAQGLAERLDAKADIANSPRALKDMLNTAHDPVLIDTPGTNPFNRCEVEDLIQFLRVAGGEPVLVLSACGDADDLRETVQIFKTLGVKKTILTHLDGTRRLGGALSALASGGTVLSHFSLTPYLADGLVQATPATLSRLILKGRDQLRDDLLQETEAHERIA